MARLEWTWTAANATALGFASAKLCAQFHLRALTDARRNRPNIPPNVRGAHAPAQVTAEIPMQLVQFGDGRWGGYTDSDAVNTLAASLHGQSATIRTRTVPSMIWASRPASPRTWIVDGRQVTSPHHIVQRDPDSAVEP